MTQVPRGTYTHLTDAAGYAQLIERYDNFLFDCDGVLWAGAEALPGVASVLNKLRQRGKRILFVTNNATKSRRVLLDRIVGMGIEASKPELFSSAYATALYLRDVLHFPADRKVYVVGMAGLEEELRDVGIHITGGSDPADHVPVEGVDFTPMLQDGVMDPAVAGVVCGLDTAFTYCKMAKAMRYLTRPGACEPVRAGEQGGGCHFVCTNEDVTFPSKAGAWPGAGSVWAGIAASSKRAPIVIGKPNQPMIDTIFESHDFDRSRTIMVGDRLNTDIAFGAKGGCDTLLVLTGIGTLDDVHKEDAPAVPTYVMQGLGELDAVL